jgi:hypothetical protein
VTARFAIRSRALKYELAISLKTAKSLGLEARPISFRYLLTDPRQFDMSSSLALASGIECNSIN